MTGPRGLDGRATWADTFARPARALLSVLAWVVLLWATPAGAHNLAYALVDLSFPTPSSVRIEVRTHVPALVVGSPPGALADDALRRFMALSDPELARRQALAQAAFLGSLSLRADGELLDRIVVSWPAATTLRRDAMTTSATPRPSAPLVLTAALPEGVRSVDVALPPALGPAVLVTRYPGATAAAQPLSDGERTHPIRIDGPSPWRDGLEAFADFVRSGFQHIVPLGFDHILFVVALAVAAPRLGALVKLATVFTLAHSVTLSLGALQVVTAPAWLVEPAICLSIAAVGVLTILSPQAAARPERLGLIFLFGLLHGLGFAEALRQTGLPRGLEAAALIGFNLGIELGQIAVIAATLAVVGWWRKAPCIGPASPCRSAPSWRSLA